jgi:hypothetical protein
LEALAEVPIGSMEDAHYVFKTFIKYLTR